MRHASPGITLAVYAKAVTADKRQAPKTLRPGLLTIPTRVPQQTSVETECSFLFLRLFPFALFANPK
jgi:hypothetical protein